MKTEIRPMGFRGETDPTFSESEAANFETGDKSKLDGIEDNANNYSLETHGSKHSDPSGDQFIPVAVASTSPGLLSGLDKTKLDALTNPINDKDSPEDIGGTAPASGTFSPLIGKAQSSIESGFEGTVSCTTTTLTFSHDLDDSMVGIGSMVVADGKTLYIIADAGDKQWTVSASNTIGAGTAITSILGPASIMKTAAGLISWIFYSDGSSVHLSPGTSTILQFFNASGNLDLGTGKLVGNGGTSGLAIDASGNIGVGTATTTGKLEIMGSAVHDLPTYSAEFLLPTGWTSTGWTGDFVTGWTHTAGNTTALSQSKAAVNATKYQIAYTVTGRTAGSFTIGFGGASLAGISATGAWGPTTSSTGSLTITPTTDFNGTIIISIKYLTAGSTPIFTLDSSEGTARIEMRANKALGNTFIGVDSGGFNTTGIYNTATGASALYSNTTGSSNSAQGVNALYSNTTGSSNSAQGIDALRFNTTGYNNSAQGVVALYSNTTGSFNSAQGVNALYSNTTGSFNSAQGVNALRSNTTGSSNSAQGVNAGRYIANGTTDRSTGDNGLYLGVGTRASADGTDNEIVIGYAAVGAGSNTVVLGNTDITSTILRGSVGIGTITPATKLHAETDSATTNAAVPVLRVAATSTGTPLAGFGPEIEFEAETSAGNNEVGSFIQSRITNATLANEAFALDFGLMTGGAAAAIYASLEANGFSAPIKNIVKSTTGNLTAAEMRGTIVNNFGQSNDVVLTFDPAAEGLGFTVILGATVAKYFRLDPNASDYILLDGVPGADGAYVGIASATIGNSIQFVSIQTGASEWNWMAYSVNGPWLGE